MKSGHQQTFVALIAVVDVDWRVHQQHAVTMDEMQETWIYFIREVLCAAFKCCFLYHLSISSKSQQAKLSRASRSLGLVRYVEQPVVWDLVFTFVVLSDL